MRVFTLLGPSQSGKSTLAEAIAALDGRSDRFDLCDTVHLHGFSYLDEPWCAIDVDGGRDAMGHAGRALAMSDAAVVVAPPDPEAAVLCAPYLRLTEAAGIPTFLFLNRMDSPNGRIRDIVAALQGYCSHHIALRQVPIREGENIVGAVDLISERAWRYREGQPSALIELPHSVEEREQEARAELLEALSDYDDHLLEQLIEDKEPPSGELYDVAAQVSRSHQLVPACLGSASHGNGLTRLMKALRHEAPEFSVLADRDAAAGSARAIAGLADIRKHLGKITVLRGLGDGARAHEPLGGGAVGNLLELDARAQRQDLAAGHVCLAVKSDHLSPGHVYDAQGATDLPGWAAAPPPGLRQVITPAHERDEARLSAALAKLAEIDPGVVLSQDPGSGHAILGCQGPQHMRRISAKLAEDFGLEIEAGPVATGYRETIRARAETRYRHRKQSGGAGQFAEVSLTVEPLPRGSGFDFKETVKGGAVPRNYMQAVAQGAGEALAEGPSGYPVADVRVTLTDGKHHAVDSSDLAFRIAAKTAVRDALVQASPIVLQPIMNAEIHLPSTHVGDLVPVISTMQGRVLGFASDPDAPGWDIFNAQLPAVSQDELHRVLASVTRGTGWVALEFDHYEEMHGPVPAAAAMA
ncbi:elongation factor G [Lutimaribacter marinistellae]|uniref:Elongation factor G n=1 Tax=Lutimaribacter marinistellae TaxID=1820329 RepID=A0ABV7TGG7_9RHOB